MPVFEPEQPIETEEPEVVVEGTLAPGRYRFRVVVEDDEGRQSEPSEVVVEVREG
jgi:hypothetical protein